MTFTVQEPGDNAEDVVILKDGVESTAEELRNAGWRLLRGGDDGQIIGAIDTTKVPGRD